MWRSVKCTSQGTTNYTKNQDTKVPHVEAGMVNIGKSEAHSSQESLLTFDTIRPFFLNFAFHWKPKSDPKVKVLLFLKKIQDVWVISVD